MKPDHQETRAELTKRVLAYVDFLLSYFKMIADNKQDYFEPRVLQTPFQFYSNGIGLRDDMKKTHRGHPIFTTTTMPYKAAKC